MNRSRWVFLCALAAATSACTENQPEIRSYEVVRTDTAVVNDARTPLKGINNLEYVAPDTLVIVDGTNNVFVARGSWTLERLGQHGDAPCSYRSIVALAYEPPLLYLSDRNRAQILAYDLRTLECVGEVQHEGIRNFSGIARHDGSMFGVRGTLTSESADDTPILLQVDGQALEELPITKGMIPADWFPMPIIISTPLREVEGALHFVLPFSNSLVRYDVSTQETELFPVQLGVPGEVDPSDMQALIAALNEKTDLVFGLDLLENSIAITSKRGEEEAAVWTVRFYDRRGFRYLGEYESTDRIIHVNDERIQTLYLDIDSEEPYRIVSLYYQ